MSEKNMGLIHHHTPCMRLQWIEKAEGWGNTPELLSQQGHMREEASSLLVGHVSYIRTDKAHHLCRRKMDFGGRVGH